MHSVKMKNYSSIKGNYKNNIICLNGEIPENALEIICKKNRERKIKRMVKYTGTLKWLK